MRIKRHKTVRKTLKFFQVNFGFREPYKVLVDGNFIHAVVSSGSKDIQGALCKLLMADVRAFTTRHTIIELRNLGKEYQATLETARNLERHKSTLEIADTPAESLKNEVANGNESHFFVATQDKALQQYLSKVAVVPVIFKTVNGMQLLKPTAELHKFVGETSERRMGLQEYEKEAPLVHELLEHDKVPYQRKRAKGPNPLSMRKKRTKASAPVVKERETSKKRRPRRKSKSSS